MSMRSPSTRACARRPRHYGDADAGDSSDDAGDRKRRRRAAARRGPSRSGYPPDAGSAAAAKLADLKAYLLRNGAAVPEDFGAWYVEFIPRGDAYFFAADGSRYRSRTVWIPTTGLGGPHQTSELSISVKSKSIRLIFGRIDRSRRVLEAQRKGLRRNFQIRAH